MSLYLLRRLLLLVPTLFGLCVVTFALIHLAPGDPVSGSPAGAELARGLSEEALEQHKRTFFLDLPLFINRDPRGLVGRTDRILTALARPGAAGEEATARAAACGTVCLPAWTATLERGVGEVTARRLREALRLIRSEHPHLLPASAPSLEEWAARARAELEPARLEQLAARLGTDRSAEDQLLARGSAALPVVMSILLGSSGEAARRASLVAGRLARHEGELTGGTDDAATRESWREWWAQVGRDHRDFSRGERLLGHLTETQFAKWMGRVLTLRFGRSIKDGRPVTEKLGEALPVTLLLALSSIFLAYLVAVPLGAWMAVRAGSRRERALGTGLLLLYSLPPFFAALLLVQLFGGLGYLDWFPIYGLATPGLEQATGLTWLVDRLRHLVLPVTCLTYGAVAVISRYQRGAMLEVLRQDYVRTAHAKGLAPATVVLKHALPNALLPVIVLFGLHFPFVISGSVVIERIFNLPGMGLLTLDALLHRDYPVIMAVAVLSAACTLVGLLVADLLTAAVDPRVRLERRP
ncbi:MAG: ABC transporter permease [Deltaproteobacteria bacterium]|nr:ABC transporter permease [Deltaproteobacteria bacterium]